MKKTFNSRFILSLFIIVLVNLYSLRAQEYKEFDLGAYYTPDIVRYELTLNGSNKGAFDKNIDGLNSNEIDGYINSDFNSYKSTRKLIRVINGGLGFNGNSSFKEGLVSGLTEKSAYIYNSGGVGINYQLYNPAKQFVTFGGGCNYGLRSDTFNKDDSLNNSDFGRSHNFWTNINLQVGAGIGRIENVTEAQQAVFMADALTKKSILSRDINRAELFSLAQEMSRIKNKRFLDSRLRLMDEVSHVDSFLVSTKLITKSDSRYFTTLYDIWLYGAAFERLSGQTLVFRIYSNLYASTSQAKYSYEISEIANYDEIFQGFSSENYISLIYQYEKPLNQRWQHSVSAQLNGVLDTYNARSDNQINNDTTSSISLNKWASLAVNYKLGFYPNTRTNFYLKIDQRLFSYFYRSSNYNSYSQIDDKISFVSETNFELGAYYYLSPQLRLSASANLYNHSNLNDINNPLRGNYSIGLSYAFF